MLCFKVFQGLRITITQIRVFSEKLNVIQAYLVKLMPFIL